MGTERLDAILDRLDALLAELDDGEQRREVREIQQLVVGVKADHETEPAVGRETEPRSDPADED